MKPKKITISIVSIGIFTLIVVFAINVSRQEAGNHELADKPTIEGYISFADSLINSSPDSAVVCYNQAKALLASLPEGFDKNHLLASAYAGIAIAYSRIGELDSALVNDSIAMVIATSNNDIEAQAKVLNLKGLVFYSKGEYTGAMENFERAVKLAEEGNNLKQKAKIISNQGMVYASQGDAEKAFANFSETLEIAKEINDDQLIAGSYINLALVYHIFDRNEKSLKSYEEARQRFNKINDKNGVLLCYQHIGGILFSQSKYDAAIDNYQESVNLALEMNNNSNAAVGYHNLAEIFVSIGDYAPASENYFKSVKIKEQLGDKKGLAKSFSGLGNLYLLINDFSNALLYYNKSLAISKEVGLKPEEAINYSNIAGVFSAGNKTDSALVYYNRAIDLLQQTNSDSGLANAFANLGNVYLIKGKNTLAEEYLKKALWLMKEMSAIEEQASVLNSLAELYLKKAIAGAPDMKAAFFADAEEAGLKSYNMAQQIGAKNVLRNAVSTLKRIYQKQGLYSKALVFSEQYNVLTDSLFSKHNAEALVFAQARWNVEKKQEEINNLEQIAGLNREIIRKNEIKAKQQKIIIVFSVILFALLIMAGVTAWVYSRKKRDIEYQRQVANIGVLRMQNIRNVLSPHFLFNVLNNIWVIIDDRENAKEQFGNLSALIRKSLMNTEKIAIPLSDEIEFVKNFLELQKLRMDGNLEVKWNIGGINPEMLVPGMILQIPVENAIKHGLAPKQGDRKLDISIHTESDNLIILVTDNGVGLRGNPSPSGSTGTGLKALTNMIHILNQKNTGKITFELSDRDIEGETGAKAAIRIPTSYNFKLNEQTN